MQSELAQNQNPTGIFDKIRKAFFENPILIKEMQIGLREKKVFGIQIIYMITLGVVAFIFSIDLLNQRLTYSGMGAVGRNYFIALCITQWFLVVLISPSLTSSSISSEREKKTLEMLLVSLLGAPEIIIGKLAYAVSYIMLLLASSLPLVALVFFLGGVSPHEIFINYLALILWGVLVSMMALFFSSRESKSASATNSAYGVLVISGLFIAGVYIPLISETGLMLGFSTKSPDLFLWICLYFNIFWTFLFFFFKTANNIRPKARHILALHYLFIAGFIINALGLIGTFLYSTPSHSDNSVVLSMLYSVSFFLMGCFIERHRFASSKEEQTMDRSVSNKGLFFPAFFFIVMFIANIFLLFSYPVVGINFLFSYLIFSAVFISLLTITKELYFLFNGKVRPVIIYYGYLLLINILPLISWIIMDAVNQGSAGISISAFSFIFIQPVLSVTSIWESSKSFGPLDFLGTEINTWILTLAFYLSLIVGIKALGAFISQARRNVAPSVLPPPGGGESRTN